MNRFTILNREQLLARAGDGNRARARPSSVSTVSSQRCSPSLLLAASAQETEIETPLLSV